MSKEQFEHLEQVLKKEWTNANTAVVYHEEIFKRNAIQTRMINKTNERMLLSSALEVK